MLNLFIFVSQLFHCEILAHGTSVTSPNFSRKSAKRPSTSKTYRATERQNVTKTVTKRSSNMDKKWETITRGLIVVCNVWSNNFCREFVMLHLLIDQTQLLLAALHKSIQAWRDMQLRNSLPMWFLDVSGCFWMFLDVFGCLWMFLV